jgi:hypothetical protein
MPIIRFEGNATELEIPTLAAKSAAKDGATVDLEDSP